MRRGDTAYLMLNYTINDEPLVEGAYQELELVIKGTRSSVRKTLTDETIKWGTLIYQDEGEEKSFTGYYTHLEQKDTFKLEEGDLSVQLRVMIDDEVSSSEMSDINFGAILSNKVLAVVNE